MVGRTLQHYRIVDRLGKGGMGEVYLAQDTKLNRRVALKILPESMAGDPDRRSRFEREAQAVAALNHPNIVTIYSVEESDDVHFITMELVEGKLLSHLIPKHGLPLSRLFDIAIPLADALGTAHQKGITHRDVKPDNVMLDDEGRIKVLDFGLAKLAEDPSRDDTELTQLPTASVTEVGRILGTVSYMSPEQAEGRPVDARSDVFSLGVVLYEMATGVRPFRGDTPVSTITSILRDEPPSITELKDKLPRHLDRIVRRCLTKDRSRRYASATELRNELEAFRDEMPSGEGVPPSPSTVGLEAAAVEVPRRRGAKIMMGGLAVLAVLFLSVLGIRFLGGGSSTAPTFVTKRSIVMEFANRTGDPELSPLGMLAADSLTDGLASLGLVEVLPTHALVGVGGGDSEQQVALRTGAGAVVSGAYYSEGDGLRFKCNVIDPAAGRVVYGVKAFSESRTDPAEAIEEIRERVMGLFAMSFAMPHNSFLGVLPRQYERLWTLSPPPRYSAFREYTAAAELHGGDYDKELVHLERAAKLDPDYFEVGLLQIVAYDNSGRYEHATEILRCWEDRRDELSEYQRYWLEWSRAILNRNHAEALRQMELADRLNPGDGLISYHIGMHALDANRPRIAVTTYSTLKPDDVYDHLWRSGILAEAYHLLGEYEDEARVSRRAQLKFSGTLSPWYGEMRALAALGRIDELEDLLARAEAFSGTGSPGALMGGAALELRAHDHRDASLRIANRAVGWHRRRDPGEAASSDGRTALASALYVAEQWAEALRLFRDLAKEDPDDVGLLVAIGTIAARTGDPDTALSVSRSLTDLDGPHRFGEAAYGRACIASLLGDREEAVTLLRESLAQGLKFRSFVHRDPDLEPLRGYAPFEDLLRPKD